MVLEPLTVPPADKPLVRCDMFEKLWCSHPAESSSGPPYPTAGAGGVDVMSSEKGVTVWRPQAPMGYGIVGDVITAGRHTQLLLLRMKRPVLLSVLNAVWKIRHIHSGSDSVGDMLLPFQLVP